VFQPGCAVQREDLLEAVEQAADGILITDASGKIQYVNPAFTALTGYSCDEAVGQNPRLLKSGRNSIAFYEEIWSTIRSGRVWHGEVINRRKDGTFYDEEMRIAPVRDESGVTTGYIAIKHDITERLVHQQAQGLLAAIVESTPDAIHSLALDGTITSWNRGSEALFGYSSLEAIGQSADILIPESDLENAKRIAEILFGGGSVPPFETVLLAKGCRAIDALITLAAIRNGAGDVVGTSAIVHDIGPRVKAERRLRESEERFRMTFENASVGVCATGLDGRFLHVNPALCQMLGYSEEELLQTTWIAVTHSEDLAFSLEKMNRLKAEPGGYLDGEHRNIHRQGRVLWVHFRVSLVRDTGGSPLYFVAHVEDITERKQAEQAILESENRFRIMADSCPLGIWVTDAQGGTRFANRAYRKFAGWTTDRVEPDLWKSAIHPEDAPAYINAVDHAIKTRSPYKREGRFRRADGEWRWKESHAAPRFSPEGEFLGLVGTSQDVTDRKQAEQALRDSEERFRQLAENIREVFWMMNAAGSAVIYVSPAYEEIWGRSCKSLYESPMDWMEAIHPDDRERAQDAFARQLKEENFSSEYRIITPEGNVKWIRDRAFPIHDDDGKLIRIAGIAEEFTERKQAEDLVRQTAQRLELATRAGAVGVWDLDISNNIMVWDEQMLSLYGIVRGQLGSEIEAWKSRLHPEDRQRALEECHAALRGESDLDTEFRVVWPEGSVRSIRALAQVERNAHGKPVRMVGTNWDITAQKLAADALLETNRQLEQESVRANQLAFEAEKATRAKSEFLANMSHEIRTPMNGVLGMTQLLLDTELTKEQRSYADTARFCGESLMGVINDILDFSKMEAKKLRTGDSGFRSSKPFGEVLRQRMPRRRRAKGLSCCILSIRRFQRCFAETQGVCARFSQTWWATPSSSLKMAKCCFASRWSRRENPIACFVSRCATRVLGFRKTRSGCSSTSSRRWIRRLRAGSAERDLAWPSQSNWLR
jgi:PAS domain S-box-containing protein